jgi:death-on-curing protein
LILNGYEIEADMNEQEQAILRVAAGEMERDDLAKWLRNHVVLRTNKRRTETRTD